MTAIPLHPMSMAEVLDRSFQVYRRHFTAMFVVALLTFLPMGFLYMSVGVPAEGGPAASSLAGLVVVAVIALPVTALGWSALADVAHRGVVGGTPGPGAALRNGLRATARALGFGVIAYLLLVVSVLVMAVPAGIAMVGVGAGVQRGSTFMIALVALSFLAVLALGLVLLTWWGALVTLALPVVVVEGAGPLRTFRRANELAKGARARIVTVGFLAWLVVMLPTVGVLLLFGLGSTLWDPAALGTLTTAEVYLQNALMSLAGVLTTPFLVASMVLLYVDRRIRREGYDVELASASLTPGA